MRTLNPDNNLYAPQIYAQAFYAQAASYDVKAIEKRCARRVFEISLILILFATFPPTKTFRWYGRSTTPPRIG